MQYADILALNRQLAEELKEKPVIHIGFFSTVTVSMGREIIECALRGAGLNAHVTLGGYNTQVEDAANFAGCDAVIYHIEAANWFEKLYYKAPQMSGDELHSVADKFSTQLELICEKLKKVPLKIISIPTALPFSLYNVRPDTYETLCVQMADIVKKLTEGWFHVDTVKIYAALGTDRAVDTRFWYSSKSLYTAEFYEQLAESVLPAFRSAYGLAKKLLIMDCDNTLWDGILGEDGPDGIKYAQTNGGGPYEEAHNIIRNLIAEGVMVSLASKNNKCDVDRLFSEKDDIAFPYDKMISPLINWEQKSVNIEKIVSSVNIGMDACVFVDDSRFETALVMAALPDVTVMQRDEKAHLFPMSMRKLSRLFFSLNTSEEDKARTDMYIQNAKREEAKKRAISPEEYIRSLDILIKISVNDAKQAQRIAQLTGKTNQFNLTTKRYSETDICGLMKKALVYSASVSDMFGASGLTGAAVVFAEGHSAQIDSYLLSCRVLGKKIEFAFLNAIMSDLRKRGVRQVTGKYIPTMKNGQTQGFYPAAGFGPAGADGIFIADTEEMISDESGITVVWNEQT